MNVCFLVKVIVSKTCYPRDALNAGTCILRKLVRDLFEMSGLHIAKDSATVQSPRHT